MVHKSVLKILEVVMWVFSNQGFFSVSASENSPGLFVVQSRFANHLEQIFPDAEVTKKPYGTLRFRATVPRWLLYQRIVNIAEIIEYNDLGGAISDPSYQRALACPITIKPACHGSRPIITPISCHG